MAEWLSHAQQQGNSKHGKAGTGLALDLNLEKLPGLGTVLHGCTALVSLEATGNSLTSLEGEGSLTELASALQAARQLHSLAV